MYESSDKVFTRKFQQHVLSFMLDCGLLKEDGKYIVAVSGGLDSMALLHCLKSLASYGYSLGLKAVHVNHGTRPEQEEEARLVRDYADSLGIDSECAKLSELDPERNFEFEARKKRYEALRSFGDDDDTLVLAHHIDDSFEWTILQSLRSSNLESSLGIPVRNGAVVRPFMCVTKAQIRRYVEAFDLPFLEDPTNESTRFERNYIRAQISEGFSQRYPKYLKHYVRRHNELARRLGKHISLKDQSDFRVYYGKDHVEIVSFKGVFNPSGLEFKILQAMNYLLPEGRGSLSGQIAKIVQAMKNNKSGPFTLSKGIKVYLSYNHLLICSPNYRSKDIELAQALSSEGNQFLFKEFTFDEYVSLLKKLYTGKKVERCWPLWVCVRRKAFNMETSRGHALWPELHGAASETGQGGKADIIPAIKLVKYWAKPKNRGKRLTLRLLLSL